LADTNGVFDAPRVLRPWIEIGDEWAIGELRKQTDACDAHWKTPDKPPGSINLFVELYGLLWRVDRADASRRAWDLYERLPEHGWPDAGHMLAHLLEWDPDRAETEIVARARAQWEAKKYLWLDVLARTHTPAARQLLREILGSSAFTF